MAGHGQAHNLYAPFYSQYIPATSRPVDALAGPTAPRRRAASTARATRTASTGSSGTASTQLAVRVGEQPPPEANSKCLFSQILPGVTRTIARCRTARLRLDLHGRERRGQRQLRAGSRMYFDNLNANKNLNGGCDLEASTRSARRRSTSWPGIRTSPSPFRTWPRIRSTSPFTTSSRRRSPPTRRARTRTASSRTRSPRSSSHTRRTSTARRSRTSWSAGWPTRTQRASGSSRGPAGSDRRRSERRHQPRSAPRPAHDLPGSVGHQPPLHLHGRVGQHGHRGLQLAQDGR